MARRRLLLWPRSNRLQIFELARNRPGEGKTVPSPVDANAAVYFLLHIPRTAGQTIQYHLADHCAPGTVWVPQRSSFPASLTGQRHRLDRLGDAAQVRAVAGHDVGRSLEGHFGGREIRRAVLLRDPLSLQLSLYNYRMMNHLNRGFGTYSFDLHLRALPRDWVAHRLLARWLEIPWPRLMAMSGAEKYRILNRMLAGFWFVGSHADCDRLIAAVAPHLGAPAAAQARNTAGQWRKQVYWQPLTADDLSPAQRQAVLSRSPLDAAIWQSWRSAGFDTAAVRPLPLEAGAGDGFLAHEMVRPAFLMARWLRRSGLWRSGGRSKTGLRSGFAKADQARYAGQWRLAAERYRRALDEEPRAPAIWVQYGHVLKLCGELAAAEQAYRQSLRFDPDNADTHVQLGHVLTLQHRPGEAAEAYRHALALDPGIGEAAVGLSALGETERVGDAA
jgi:tetratricopeptide (TPR) repeat protein